MPVAGVTVTVTGPQGEKIVVTDTDGRFTVSLLTPGTYQLRAERPDFKTIQNNDITVGAVDSTFGQIWTSSCGLRPSNNRSMVDIVAPGDQVNLAAANWEGGNPDWLQRSGTSYATPHVASVVAGMNQYTDAASLPQSSKDPWVTRAIIVNAANKNVKDSGGVLWKDTEANTSGTHGTPGMRHAGR